MDTSQKQVQQFHATFGVPYTSKPTVPSFKERVLRFSLIYEEALEVADALGVITNLPAMFEVISNGDCDLVEVADGLADLKYVTEGAACTCGIDLQPVSGEVHRSNMTKTGGATREDGKILKGPNYEPPKIRPILEVQGWEG